MAKCAVSLVGILAVAFSLLAHAEKVICVNKGGGVTECNTVEERYQPAGVMTSPWCIVMPNGNALPALIQCKYESKAPCMKDIQFVSPSLGWRCVKNPQYE